MSEFTWIKVYKGIAKAILPYENRQMELLKMLHDLQEQGLPTISLKDKNEQGEDIPLDEIDPFSFFSNWNRGINCRPRCSYCPTMVRPTPFYRPLLMR